MPNEKTGIDLSTIENNFTDFDKSTLKTNLSLQSITEKIQNIFKVISEKPKIQPVVVISKAYEYSKPEFERITTTNTAYQKDPDYIFKNPLDSEVSLMTLTLLPDTSFKTMGAIKIQIGDQDYFEITAGKFTDVSTFAVPISNEGQKLERGKYVKVWILTNNTVVAISISTLYQKQKVNV